MCGTYENTKIVLNTSLSHLQKIIVAFASFMDVYLCQEKF